MSCTSHTAVSLQSWNYYEQAQMSLTTEYRRWHKHMQSVGHSIHFKIYNTVRFVDVQRRFSSSKSSDPVIAI